MKKPSTTSQMMLSMENRGGNASEDNKEVIKEVIHHEDREEDFNPTILNNNNCKVTNYFNKAIKGIQDIKVTKATHNKVNKTIHKDQNNTEAIFEVSPTLEATQTSLETHWILAIMP